jgi:hypothetical protein
MKKGFTLLILAGLCCLAGGCSGDGKSGYTLASQYRDDIKTVAVDIFSRGKDVYRRELEFRLTEAIVKRIEQDTPYKVTVKKRADTLLTGTINSVDQRILSYDSDTGKPRELELTLKISYTWSDLRTGKILVANKDFEVSGTYTYEAPLTEDFFQGSENVINRLAVRLVETMEKPW